MNLNEREFSTVLAALRYWQSNPARRALPEWDIATNAGVLEPLDDDEIDELCEQFNCGAEEE